VGPKVAGEPGGRDARFHDPADRPRRKISADLAMPVNAAKDGALDERDGAEPTLQRANCTLLELGCECNGDLFSFTLLVALRAPDREHHALTLEPEVGELEPGELAAAQRGRPTDENDRAIAQAPQIVWNRCENGEERIAHERGLLLLRDAELTAVPALDVAHDAVRRRRIEARGFVINAIVASLRAMVAVQRPRAASAT
jgi:hypothetical protein